MNGIPDDAVTIACPCTVCSQLADRLGLAWPLKAAVSPGLADAIRGRSPRLTLAAVHRLVELAHSADWPATGAAGPWPIPAPTDNA
ncbi:MAG: hypothetical protein WAL50_16280 [Kineosporiaceae bacterium]